MKKVIINNLITVIGLITITDMTVTVTNVTVTEWLKNFIVVLLAISIGFSNIWPKPTIIIGLTGLFLYIENISNNISYVIYNKIDTTITYEILTYAINLIIIVIVAIATEFTIEELTLKKIFLDGTTSFLIILLQNNISIILMQILLYLSLAIFVVIIDDCLHLRKIKT